MKNLTPKQLGKWLRSLPEDTPIFNNPDWTVQQLDAAYARYDADQAAFNKLQAALEALDKSLASDCINSTYESVQGRFKEGQLMYWSHLHHRLGYTAGMIWESENRNVNDELGYAVY